MIHACVPFLFVGMNDTSDSLAEVLAKKGFRVFAIDKDPARLSKGMEEGYLFGASSQNDRSFLESCQVIFLNGDDYREWIREYAGLTGDNTFFFREESASEAYQDNFLLDGNRELVGYETEFHNGLVTHMKAFLLPEHSIPVKMMAHRIEGAVNTYPKGERG